MSRPPLDPELLDLDRRIAELQLLKRKLSSCIKCGCLSLEKCGLYNPEDRAFQEDAGARALPPIDP